MIGLVALLVVAVAAGVLRPRRSTLAAAVVPALLAFAWLAMHEDIPGYSYGLSDYAWWAGMSLAVGAAFALAVAVGIAVGGEHTRRPRAGSRRGSQ